MDNETMLTVRIPGDLVKLAKLVSKSRDETISQVIRRALKAYVDSSPAQFDLVEAVRAVKPSRLSKAKLGSAEKSERSEAFSLPLGGLG